jgi:acyl-CoA reductase-like NAD-dependent aldehyde dehydrogenase
LKVVDPSTGRVVRDVEADTQPSVDRKYEEARVAAPGWAATALDERVAIVRRFGALMDERRDELALALTVETGKPITQSRHELAGVAPRLDYFVDHVEAVLARETVHDEATLREVIAYEPLGVVLNISAWNYPWFVGSNVFVPALLTGNAVLYKPSEQALLTGLAIDELWRDAGLAPGAFQLVIGAGDVGAMLVDLPVDGVFFTGSYATGRRIAEATAARMIPVQLELGGKDPVYVADDVDVEVAAEALADGAFYNNGQSCCSVERIYVHDRIHDQFVSAFVKAVEGFTMGDPGDEDTYLGPLTRPQQVEVLEDQVADAVALGATVRTGGRRVADRPGAWFEPTVLTGTDHRMRVMREESFGPIIGIQAVASDGEAVELMNDTEYGLTAGVFSSDEGRAGRILDRVDAGSAYWNCCDRVSPRLPWTGRRHSGIGSTLSTAGIRAFVRPKAWHLRGAPPS